MNPEPILTTATNATLMQPTISSYPDHCNCLLTVAPDSHVPSSFYSQCTRQNYLLKHKSGQITSPLKTFQYFLFQSKEKPESSRWLTRLQMIWPLMFLSPPSSA